MAKDNLAQQRKHKMPKDGTPFTAINATAVAAAATPQALKAAPGALIAIHVCWAIFTQLTTAEFADLDLRDEDDVKHARVIQGQGSTKYEFEPPIVLAVNKALECGITGDVGDSHVTVGGYTAAVESV